MSKYIRWTLVFLIGLGLSSSNAVGKKPAKSANDVMDLAKLAHGITVQIVTSTGMGSGVWVSDKGYIATCWHVVKDSDSITVQFGGTEHLDLENYRIATANFIHFGASVVDHDEISDVAILKLGGGANPFGGPPHTPDYVFPNPIAATFDTRAKLSFCQFCQVVSSPAPWPDFSSTICSWPLAPRESHTWENNTFALSWC
jgi:hypothetical protein